MQPMILSRSKKKARTYVLAFLEFTSLDLLNISSLPWLGVLSAWLVPMPYGHYPKTFLNH